MSRHNAFKHFPKINDQFDVLVDQTKDIIQLVLDRGVPINSLLKATEKNALSADMFKTNAGALKKNMFWGTSNVHYVNLFVLMLIVLVLFSMYFESKNSEYITAFSAMSIIFLVYFSVICIISRPSKKIIIGICLVFIILVSVLLIHVNEKWKEEENAGTLNPRLKEIHLGLLIFLLLHAIITGII